MIIYLAGGMSQEEGRNWRSKVIQAAPSHKYIDPTTHGLITEEEYTIWDLEGVKKCDLVFAYLEEKNPTGHGMCLEIGYAKALGKPIILLDEKNERAFGMARACSDVVFSVFEDAMDTLIALEKI